MPRDDALTISRLVSSAGDESDFQRLFERHVVAVEEAVARVWNLEISEQAEAVEEAFVRVFSRLKALKEPGRFDECLLGTAYGIALRRGRPESGAASGDFDEKPFIGAPFPMVQGSRSEAEGWLSEALSALPPETRTLAEECFFGPKTRPQIAAAARSMEVAAVGAELDAAYGRMKAEVLRHALEQLLKTRPPAAEPPKPRSGPLGAASELHLSDDLLAEILQGTIPAQDAETLLRHLREHCLKCEAYLSRKGTADSLDGFVMAALFSGKAGHRSNPAMFGRIMRRLRLDARLGSGSLDEAVLRRRRNDRLPLTFAVFLGIFGIAVFAFSATPRFAGRSEQLRDQPAAIELFVMPSADEGGEQLKPVDAEERAELCVPGQRLPASAQLAVTYELGRSQFAAVLRLRPDETIELLEAPSRRPPGRHVLSFDGAPARLNVRGAPGVNRFAVISSEHPIDIDDLEQMKLVLEALLEREESSGSGTFGRQIFVSWVDVHVAAEGIGPKGGGL